VFSDPYSVPERGGFAAGRYIVLLNQPAPKPSKSLLFQLPPPGFKTNNAKTLPTNIPENINTLTHHQKAFDITTSANYNKISRGEKDI